MEVTVNEFRHCTLVKASGRIDSATAPQLADTLNDIMQGGVYRIVLDMASVDYISSSGLRVLINTLKNCKRYNRGELVLSNVTPRVYSALDLAGFVPFFKIYDDVTSAVGQF